MSAPFWSVHTHSRYSAKDAMPSVASLVSMAADLGYPALALTDHGNPSGAVQLYKECKKNGIKPLPGVELYFTPERSWKEQSNYHLTVVSYSETGYRNLVKMTNLSAQNFYYKPRLDFADLAQLAEDDLTTGLAVSTGCFFGIVVKTLLERGEREAMQIIIRLAGWFPKLYVELQNHGIVHPDGSTDDDIVAALVGIADRLGLPYLIAQDSHYLRLEEKPLHESFKQLVGYGDDPNEVVFPGDGFHMVDRAYLENYYEPLVLDRACDNLADLAARSCVRLPELEQFQLKVPDVTFSGNPVKELRERIWSALELRQLSAAKKRAWTTRLKEELEVIEFAEMAGYLMLVADVCDFMTKRDIWFHARGSAAGSLVVYLLGVSTVDPMHWGLRFDRFLSRDRTRPPDVDLDVERERRDEVILHLESIGEVRQVGSHMKLDLFDDKDDSAGSLRIAYNSLRRKQGKPYIAEWRYIPTSDQKMLRSLAGLELISGNGTHAAGYIVAPDPEAIKQLPLAYMSSRDDFVTAYGKKDVEALGFVKIDLLGLRTLTAIKTTCEAIAEQDEVQPKRVWDRIPNTDSATFARIGRGEVDGVFQLEGTAMRRGCKELKPTKLADLVAAQALFRPATRMSGATDDYLARRAGLSVVPERHADIATETKETFGVLLYQEQVISVMRNMGMPPAELTDMLDAVKASNEASAGAAVALEQAKPRIESLALARGWTAVDIRWLLNALVAYAEYSFNKAHSAVYGTVGYRQAYLSEHYPLEFWFGILTAFTGSKQRKGKKVIDKEADYVKAARGYQIRILAPHVNASSVGYTLERGAIRRGLISVKGCGVAASTELVSKAPFTSLADLGQRVVPSRVPGAKHLALGVPPMECGGVITPLYIAQAFDKLESA